MPSPSHWSDPADSEQTQRRSSGRGARRDVRPCDACHQNPATQPVRLAVGAQIRLDATICNICAAGAATDPITLTFGVMDRRYTLRTPGV